MIVLVATFLFVSFSLFLCNFFTCDLFSLSFVFAQKMKNLQPLVNETKKKFAAKKRCKTVQSMDQLITGSGPGSTSSPVVELADARTALEAARLAEEKLPFLGS